MDLSLDLLVDYIYSLSPLSIYIIFFLIAYGENVMPPIPGDLLLVYGGYLAAEQLVRFSTLLWVTAASSVLGFMTMYAVGSYWGYQIDAQKERFWLLRMIGTRYFERGKRWMQRWGQWVVVANRFLPGTRSVISLTSGIYRMNVKNTVISSTVSSLLWNAILLQSGWMVHENWQLIGSYLSLYGRLILAALLFFLGLRLVIKRVRKREKGPG